jgi:hypothetical protein
MVTGLPDRNTPFLAERKVKMKGRLSFIDLGKIMLNQFGDAACQAGYGTVDPEWVGRNAVQYGDINRDGTLN